jgi:hypothetical protein
VPVDEGLTFSKDGDADTVKSAFGLTVSVTLAVWTSEPLVPVMVSVNVPVLVLAVVETVRVEVAVGFGVTELEESEQVAPVAPDGQPVMVRPTVPVNPFSAVTVIVEVPDLPCVSVSDLGLRDREKFAADAGLTVSVMLVE